MSGLFVLQHNARKVSLYLCVIYKNSSNYPGILINAHGNGLRVLTAVSLGRSTCLEVQAYYTQVSLF